MAEKSRIVKGTAAGAALLVIVTGFEGLRRVAYMDPVGIPTVCFGETRGVHMGDVHTAQECKDMLAGRLMEFENGVRACMKYPSLVPDGVYVATISFAYNVGVGTFCNSTMRKKIDAGDYKGACDELLKFVYAKHVYFPGLARRRAAEREICLKTVL